MVSALDSRVSGLGLNPGLHSHLQLVENPTIKFISEPLSTQVYKCVLGDNPAMD